MNVEENWLSLDKIFEITAEYTFWLFWKLWKNIMWHMKFKRISNNKGGGLITPKV